MSPRIVPLILAGGHGTRLWPISRTSHPKQFIPLTGPLSLFQNTVLRAADDTRYTAPIIITNSDYRFLVAEHANSVGIVPAAILLEPVARNTAAAIIAGAVFAAGMFGSDAILHVMPSDHEIGADAGYFAAIDTAAEGAGTGRLITFGIAATRPETGYGYIQPAAERLSGIHDISRFIEKPTLAEAGRMLADGGYLWNSGMFMLEAKAFLAECQVLCPDILSPMTASIALATRDLDFVRLEIQSFASAPSISIDHAVFEKTALASVIPVDFVWSDLGAWDAVWKASPKSADGNVERGPAIFAGSTNCLAISERLHIAIQGLDGVAVIASEDAIFVGKLNEAQKVGALVHALRQTPETAALTTTHRTAYRPWGGYASVLEGERFQVKRLFVKPGKQLSLQRHHHRSEHWIVVRGTAEVTLDGTKRLLCENESIYLPVGAEHRLANPGKIDLELIEVQTGSYLGEDDIIRIEDDFGRC